jgi:hypothetical protein
MAPNDAPSLSDKIIYLNQEHMLATQNVSEEEEVEAQTLEHCALPATKVINETKWRYGEANL